MLTAQRFQLSVLAGGEAERWPPISLNTWSPPIPCLSLSLSFSLSLSRYSSQSWRGGWQLSASQPVKKGLLFSTLPLGQEEKHTHTYTHTHACANTHTHTHGNPCTLGEHAFTKALYTAHTHALCLSHAHTHIHTHKYFFLRPRNTCAYKNFWLLLEDVLLVVSISQNMLTFCMR